MVELSSATLICFIKVKKKAACIDGNYAKIVIERGCRYIICIISQKHCHIIYQVLEEQILNVKNKRENLDSHNAQTAFHDWRRDFFCYLRVFYAIVHIGK